MRESTFGGGGEKLFFISSSEGSQAVPVRLSDKGIFERGYEA
jgi:hypothetical protein